MKTDTKNGWEVSSSLVVNHTANLDLISGDNSAQTLLAKIKAERMQITKKNKVKTLGQ